MLRFLADKRGAAGWHLTPQQASALQQELLPQAIAHRNLIIPPCSACMSAYAHVSFTHVSYTDMWKGRLLKLSMGLQALAALLNAAAIYWATSTPLDTSAAAGTSSSAHDPAALIAKLQLVAAGSGKPRLAPPPAQQTGGSQTAAAGPLANVTVAHLFLPELARQYGGEQFHQIEQQQAHCQPTCCLTPWH